LCCQAKRFGTAMLMDSVATIDTRSRPFALRTTSGLAFRSHALIVASGATERWLDLNGEGALRGR
jgi:thioredoxin reductase (NADPH)